MSKKQKNAGRRSESLTGGSGDVASYSDALEHLYAVFAKYSGPRDLGGCPCCTTEEHSKILVSKTLRELASDELEEYARKALTTWGTLNDYKYFLPRVMELALQDSFSYCAEMMLEKLSYGGFPEWERVERQAVMGVLRSSWCDAINAMDTKIADAILCSVGSLVKDVSVLLDDADRVNLDFRSEYAAYCGDPMKRTLSNSFWKRGSCSYEQVLDWAYPAPTL